MTFPLIHNFDPDKAIIRSATGVVSQHDLLARAQGLARRLPDHEYVINLCEDRYYFMLALVSAIQSKRTTLLPPSRHTNDINAAARRYQSTIILTDTSLNDHAKLGTKVVNLRTLDIESDAIATSVPLLESEQPVAIAFTSGSTGKPTAHTKLWGTLANTCQRLAQRFGFDKRSPTIVATVPSQHMYGLEMTVIAALQGGAELAPEQPFFPQDIASCLANYRNPLLVTTPVHLRAAVRANITFPQANHIVSATAPLSTELAASAEQLFNCELEEIYGCTEAGSIATRRTVDSDDWRLLEEFAFDGKSAEPILHVPYLPEPVPLADQIEQTKNGFKLLGRNADMLNVAGKRYSLSDLNAVLQSLPEITDGAAFLPDDASEIERPAAVVVSVHSTREIGAALAKHVDAPFIPRPIVKVESIPRNSTGKVSRSELTALLPQNPNGT